jgi:hypothetical protein
MILLINGSIVAMFLNIHAKNAHYLSAPGKSYTSIRLKVILIEQNSSADIDRHKHFTRLSVELIYIWLHYSNF